MKYRNQNIGAIALKNLMVQYILRDQPLSELHRQIWGLPSEEFWQATVLKAEKAAKARRMAEVSIGNLVKLKLKGTGLKYRLEPQQLRVSVYLLLHGNQQLQIALSHKNFMSQIDNVIQAAQMIDQVMRQVGQIVRMRSAPSYTRWFDPDES